MIIVLGAVVIIGLAFVGFGLYCVGLLRGYRKGYEFARSLVGKDKIPPYERLHEELP